MSVVDSEELLKKQTWESKKKNKKKQRKEKKIFFHDKITSKNFDNRISDIGQC